MIQRSAQNQCVLLTKIKKFSWPLFFLFCSMFQVSYQAAGQVLPVAIWLLALDRSNPDSYRDVLTTEPPLLGRYCYELLFFHYFIHTPKSVITDSKKINSNRKVIQIHFQFTFIKFRRCSVYLGQYFSCNI
jgi:hypothetical protein